MAGRPPLRIGQHGKITRSEVASGVWVARCRYRDTDGVTRIVQKRTPQGEVDQRGRLAEDALVEALKTRRPPGGTEVGLDTKIAVLVDRHLGRLEEDGRSPVTISTYKFAAGKLERFISGVRVGEATPARVDAALRSMRSAHGATMARQAKTILMGALQLAVMANVLGTNPVRDVQSIRSKTPPKGAPALTSDQLRVLLAKIQASDYCVQHDLADPIIVFIATGLRMSELLGLRWVDFDETAGTLTISGKVVRAKGKGLQRLDQTKTAAGQRAVPLPAFATAALADRRCREYVGEQPMIFPSTAGTWRDPNNFNKRWRGVRDTLNVPDVSSHSFRKTLATLVDDEGLSPRIAADQLGHRNVSMTQNVYQARGRTHQVVADLLDRTISGE